MNSATAVMCELCGEEIRDYRAAYQLASGWAKPRSQGGTNALALRQTFPKWAHPRCVDKAARVGVEQGELFG